MTVRPGTPTTTQPRRRLLSADERASEVLFGLIMVMTFTGSFSVAKAGHEEMHEMLVAAVGCSIAWGVVDACMYVMSALVTRGIGSETLRRVRAAATPAEGNGIVREALPEPVAQVMDEDELSRLRARLVGLSEPPRHPRVRARDVFGAIAVFLLVVLATVPVVVPFFVMRDALTAVRVSHGVAIAIMFMVGLRLGRRAGTSAVAAGIATALLGLALAALTLWLGG